MMLVRRERTNGYRALRTHSKTGSISVVGRTLCSIDLRYKEPDSDMSQLLDLPITDFSASFNNFTENMCAGAPSIAAASVCCPVTPPTKEVAIVRDVINWA
ncbi:MAG: hypothetical protein IPL65_09625 [Lewinellaceae bacterium]|nr:hypothetical protein [Lewinellaceae bacterium]